MILQGWLDGRTREASAPGGRGPAGGGRWRSPAWRPSCSGGRSTPSAPPPFGTRPTRRWSRCRPGASARAVVRALARAGVLSDAELAWRYVRFVKRDPRPLKAGEYAFAGPLTPDEALERIYKGEVRLYRFTVPEGLRVDDIAEIVGAQRPGQGRGLPAAGPLRRRGPRPRRPGRRPRGLPLPRHLRLRARRHRPADPRGHGAPRPRRVRAGRRPPFTRREAGPGRGHDPGLDHREGDRPAGRAAAHQLRLPQPAGAAHQAPDRSHGDVRHLPAHRPLVQEHLQGRPADAAPLQHLHQRRASRPAPSPAPAPRPSRRRCSRRPATTSSSSRATTAPTSSAPTWPATSGR